MCSCAGYRVSAMAKRTSCRNRLSITQRNYRFSTGSKAPPCSLQRLQSIGCVAVLGIEFQRLLVAGAGGGLVADCLVALGQAVVQVAVFRVQRHAKLEYLHACRLTARAQQFIAPAVDIALG